MSAVEELEEVLAEVLTLDQAQQLADFDRTAVVDGGSSTQQLLDEMLGRFDDDDPPVFLAHSLTPANYPDSDE